MLKGVIPINQIKKWKNDDELFEFCEHIIEHAERYERSRVFEAEEELMQRPKNNQK